jgi:5-formyltetrahydrofolate cyclo-ligase
LQEVLSEGRVLALPRVEGDRLVFCNVRKFEDLEKGEFGIMEPKQNCPPLTEFDVIIVPAIAMTVDGHRLGYGRGFYDRFLAGTTATTIALAYSKTILKNIPRAKNDVIIQWIATEDGVIHTS